LLCDSELRLRYGGAGRARLSNISELNRQLLHSLNSSRHHRFLLPNHVTTTLRTRRRSPGRLRRGKQRSGYRNCLSDRSWPDNDLPLLERELQEMKASVPQSRDADCAVRCELNPEAVSIEQWNKLRRRWNFCRTPWRWEAEWRANPALAQKLGRRTSPAKRRAPGAIFLRQARFALALGRQLEEKKVLAPPRHEFPCAGLCAHVKKTSQRHGEHHDRSPARITAKLDRRGIVECVGGRLAIGNCSMDAVIRLFSIRRHSVLLPRKALGLRSLVRLG